ncbi:MAG: M56 family metallopeptidase [Phycisphaerae bacterium]
MNAMEQILSQPVIYQVGWALVHFLWQAVAVGVLLGIALLVLRNRRANVRYITACIALLLMAILPAVTMQVMWEPPSRIDLASPISAAKIIISTPPASANADHPIEPAAIVAAGVSLPPQLWHKRAATILENHLPWIVAGWLTGVMLLSIRLLASWLWTQQIKHSRTLPVPTRRQEQFLDLARRIGVSRPVRLLESALTAVPIVIGHLRPVILLPASALTGLTPSQLEAILIHELAHIRRYDYLVNLIQTVIETLLFYHPAVWWVSRRIRIERENCCDDLAVQFCGDRLTYARALVTMEELRQDHGQLAVAADGGSLLSRIQRLVNLPTNSFASPRWMAGMAGLATVIILLTGLTLSTYVLAADKSQDQKTDLSSDQLLQKISKTYTSARQEFRNVEIVASVREYQWNAGGKNWIRTPARTHVRAWYEKCPPGKVRIEFDPEIHPWMGGPTPYGENRDLLAYDGNTFRKIDFVYNGRFYESRISDKQKGWNRVLPSTSMYTGLRLTPFDADQGIFRLLFEALEDKKKWFGRQNIYIHAQTIQQNGQPIVKLEIGRHPSSITDIYYLDPAKNFALISYEWWWTDRKDNRRFLMSSVHVDAWKKIRNSLLFPTHAVSQWLNQRNQPDKKLMSIYQAQSVNFFDPAKSDILFTASDIELGKRTAQMPIGPLTVKPIPSFEEPSVPANMPVVDMVILPQKQKSENAAEGKFELDRPIQVSVKSPAGKYEKMEIRWVEFRKVKNDLKATAFVSYPSGPKAKWQIGIELLDKQNKVLAQAKTYLENRGIILGVPAMMESNLEFNFGPYNAVADVVTFKITVTRISEEDNAGATAGSSSRVLKSTVGQADRGTKQKPVSKGSPSVIFGLTIPCSLPASDFLGDTRAFIDFRTGKTFVFPSFVPIDNSQWRTLAPTQFDARWHGTHPPLTQLSCFGWDALPRTFLFRTRDGQKGLVQIIDVRDDFEVLFLRYKLIEAAPSGEFRQAGSPDPALGYWKNDLVQGAELTYMRHMRKGKNSGDNGIAPELWTEPVRELKPLYVYTHMANLVVVLKKTDQVEEGLYIALPISSSIPDGGSDGFVLTAKKDGVYHFTRYALPRDFPKPTVSSQPATQPAGKKMVVLGSIDGWGKESEGVQIRLRSETKKWRPNELITLYGDFRNQSNRPFWFFPTQWYGILKVDDKLYTRSVQLSMPATVLKPGETYPDIPLKLTDVWHTHSGGEPLKLSPGRHIVQFIPVRLLPLPEDKGPFPNPHSNLVEIEIYPLSFSTPTTQPTEQEPRATAGSSSRGLKSTVGQADRGTRQFPAAPANR